MYNVILVLILLYLLFDSRTEKFGYAGAYKPIDGVKLDDPGADMRDYIVAEKIEINNDLTEQFVLLTNKYVYDQTGIHNYIIETTDIKQYKHKTKNHSLYRCVYMCVKPSGFAFGFSVTSDIMYVSGNARVLGVHSQQLDIKQPSNTTPFESDISGSEFVHYDDIRESELEVIKK